MVSIYDIKPLFQRSLRPVLAALVRLKVTPNQITLLALLLSVAGGSLLALQPGSWVLLMLPLLLLVRMALNALDGMLARQQSLSSSLGEILNEMGDVLADVALYLPLVFYTMSIESMLWIVLFVIFAILTEFSGLLSKLIRNHRAYDGPMGKSDRAFAIGIYALFLYFSPLLAMEYTTVIFAVLVALSGLTCLNRLKTALKEV